MRYELGPDVVVSAHDNCSAVLDVQLLGCRSSEAADGTGDGSTEPDCVVVSPSELLLRAERSGNGDGRTYSLQVVVTDEAGNSAVGETDVRVAHDQREHDCPRLARSRLVGR